MRREGGTVASEAAVEKGLDWLARHQRADGGWSLDISGQCQKGNGCPGPAGDEPVDTSAATGRNASLPFLAARARPHTEKGAGTRETPSIRGSRGSSSTKGEMESSSSAASSTPACTATPSPPWPCAKVTG